MGTYDNWIGNTESVEGMIDPWRVHALANVLGTEGSAPVPGDELPLAWHWAHLLATPRHSELGEDGHGRRGDFLPPVELPARMWAGGKIRMGKSLIIGSPGRRDSMVAQVRDTRGSTGPLTIVTVAHRYASDGGGFVDEEQVLVYRSHRSADEPLQTGVAPPQNAHWRHAWKADERMLFRYSALTFNAHRVHYDLDYCRRVEGLSGLLVHAPLLATTLAELGRAAETRAGRTIRTFAYRAHAPVFHSEEFWACGAPLPDGADLWIEDQAGSARMTARLAWAPAGASAE